MTHVSLKLTQASQQELAAYGITVSLIVLLVLGVLLWRDRHKVNKKSSRPEKPGKRKAKRR